MQVRGYLHEPRPRQDEETGEADPTVQQIASDLFTSVLRGQRQPRVRQRPRRRSSCTPPGCATLCEEARVPNEFLPHHGNLVQGAARGRRSRPEDPSRPATAVVHHHAGDGHRHRQRPLRRPGRARRPSVAALRQRLGRSGRRGEPAILRIYVTEPAVDPRTSRRDELRAELVQTSRC